MKIDAEVKKKFDEKNMRRKYDFLRRRSDILKRVAKADNILTAINDIWLKSMKGEVSRTEAEEKTEQYNVELEKLLKKNGYSTADIEYKPSCPLCEDSGYNGGAVCKCLETFAIEQNYTDSMLDKALKRENFDTFDEKLFSEKKDDKNSAPRETIIKARKKCEAFIKHFDEKYENLLIIGKAGTGKTFLTHCVANELIKKGYSVIYTSAYALINRLTKIAIGEEDDGFERMVASSDLLIIDDLGTERQTDFSEGQLYNILNARISAEKPVIISTNLDIADLNNKYGERIISRIFGNFSGIAMHNEDVRLKKKF